MDTINSPAKLALRDALIQFGCERPRTHWLTLNTHRELSDEEALKRLKRWRVEILRRMHGRRFYRLPDAERFEFFGAQEQTAAGHPHFHFACAVPEQLAGRFFRHAEARWLAIVPSGSCWLESFNADPPSIERRVGYSLKCFNPRAPTAFIDSRLFTYES
jgi:hypothetical protein